VEAGKKMAGAIIALQNEVLTHLHNHPGKAFSVEEIANAVKAGDRVESVFKILQHASANRDHKIKKTAEDGALSSRFQALS
jgi:glucose-6-phosphate isomerase